MQEAAAGFVWGNELPLIEGSKVRLRHLREADAPEIFAIFGDAEVVQYWSSAPLPDVSAAAAFIQQIRTAFDERRLFQWGVTRSDGDAVVGTCTLYHLDLPHRRGEVGFALRRDVWGQGLATDVLSSVIRFAFDTLDLHRLEADVDPHNVRSQRVLERQGFRREGYLRERWHHLGQLEDAIFMGLLRHEWSGRTGGEITTEAQRSHRDPQR